MRKLKLYSRMECPLCEYAEELLADAGIEFDFVDIDESPDLIKRYHVRVPVLASELTELNWPFTAEQAEALSEELPHG